MPERSDGIAMRVHDLVGRRVVDADDRTIGRVIDLEIDHQRDFSIVAIELGRFGMLERIGLLRILGRSDGPRVVPWTSVERVEERVVRLRRGAPEPRQGGTKETGPAAEDSAGATIADDRRARR